MFPNVTHAAVNWPSIIDDPTGEHLIKKLIDLLPNLMSFNVLARIFQIEGFVGQPKDASR
jgi:hypothetical protein